MDHSTRLNDNETSLVRVRVPTHEMSMGRDEGFGENAEKTDKSCPISIPILQLSLKKIKGSSF
jgi:hypothetical protein